MGGYTRPMLTLGIETSCDETGVALYDSQRGLLGQALHSQVAMHERYGGVVPELASRDHIRRIVPLTRQVLQEAGCSLAQVDAIEDSADNIYNLYNIYNIYNIINIHKVVHDHLHGSGAASRSSAT